MALKRKPLAAKPGSKAGTVAPDNILTFTVGKAAGKGHPAPASNVAGKGHPAPADGEELTLLPFLYSALPAAKRTTVKDYLKYNQVMVNGNVTTQFNRALAPGDVVKVNTSREFQVFHHKRLKLVYEDDDIIVIEKGYGLLSMATDREKSETAYTILREYLKRKDPRNKLFIVHRLDRDTTGLMMFAKNEAAKDAMQHNWNNMVLERRYLAVIEGDMEPEEGEIRSYLAENAAHEVYSTKKPGEGQLAVTYYRTLRKRAPYSLVELSLATGRKNQIRVHLKDAGHPISGDRRYGAKSSPIHRLCLHAQTLRFVHPTTKRDMNFSCPIPAGFIRMVGK